ncbi:putative quinol monooxygenase [Microlunatus soli]|uniref:Quinol monooxygenase YgiN n=1 Tax=Microlunatus soli TaxID=630515 RepID=A0A1H1XJC5_9ACTN|nr:antibiotic biosynthesis monooxygenase family protein [Microlunatus soli]SDT08826.1 Quinol monooxygenase YgiN [Microlunatus soli]
MWIIAGHARVAAERRDDYVAAHVDLVRRAREAPGCLDVAITADPADQGRVNVFERWDSWDSLEAWRTVAHAPETGIALDEVAVKAYEVSNEREPF